MSLFNLNKDCLIIEMESEVKVLKVLSKSLCLIYRLHWLLWGASGRRTQEKETHFETIPQAKSIEWPG